MDMSVIATRHGSSLDLNHFESGPWCSSGCRLTATKLLFAFVFVFVFVFLSEVVFSFAVIFVFVVMFLFVFSLKSSQDWSLVLLWLSHNYH